MPGESGQNGIRVGRLLWSRLIWRHWRKEPSFVAVLATILALGVGVFLAVRLANKAAVSGFSLFTESVTGESDFLLRSRSGFLGQSLLVDLRRATGRNPVDIFPLLEIPGGLRGSGDERRLRLVGVDLVALGNLGASPSPGEGGSASGREDLPLGRPDRAYVGSAFVDRQGKGEGERFRVVVDDREREIEIAGILPDRPGRSEIPDDVVLFDLPGLQDLSGRVGELTRVEFRVPAGVDRKRRGAEVIRALIAFSEDRELVLETPEDRKDSVTQMSAAFRLNLAILSGLALLVGVYLILQAMEAAVVKRRGEIAILRSLGVTPIQIRVAWLLEGLALGAVGTVVGILLGRLLAVGLVGAIARTVNELYYRTTASAVNLELGEVAFCLAFGIGTSVVAALVPARDASLTPPAQALRQGAQGGGLGLLRKWPIGLLLVIAGFFLARLAPVESGAGMAIPLGGYLAAGVFVVGASILLGSLFRPVAGFLGARKGNPMRRYAASHLRQPGGRHRLTAAGLAVAIGMAAAMGILVASFEFTLTRWIGQLLRADLYVAAAVAGASGSENTLSPETWRTIEGIPGIAGADRLRRYRVETEEARFFLGGADYHSDPARRLDLVWLDPPDDRGPLSLEETEGDRVPAWISEPYSRRFGCGKGDSIRVPTPAGTRDLVVRGIYADYGAEAGTILVSRRFTSRWFDDERLSNLALYAKPGVDVDELAERIRKVFPAAQVRTNARLRSESLRIFHQTFSVTYALEAIAVLIAVSGLGLALAGLLLERHNELGTLRSIGTTRREIARAAGWEGLGIATVGLLGGILLSFVLGWVLIHVINPQSFGWTLRYRVPWGSLALLCGLTLAVAWWVSCIVGRRSANLESDRVE